MYNILTGASPLQHKDKVPAEFGRCEGVVIIELVSVIQEGPNSIMITPSHLVFV